MLWPRRILLSAIVAVRNPLSPSMQGKGYQVRLFVCSGPGSPPAFCYNSSVFKEPEFKTDADGYVFQTAAGPASSTALCPVAELVLNRLFTPLLYLHNSPATESRPCLGVPSMIISNGVASLCCFYVILSPLLYFVPPLHPHYSA